MSLDEHDLGTLASDGERWTLTFTRRLAHAPENVWRAVTEPEHLAAWFPQKIVGEFRTGAPLRFESAMGDGFEGEMVLFDPPRVMEMTWGGDRLRLEVRPDGDGTILTLTDTFGELGKAARDAAGWHECLDRLAADTDGAPMPDPGSVWRAVNPRYRERFGPDASTIGPPESHEDVTGA